MEDGSHTTDWKVSPHGSKPSEMEKAYTPYSNDTEDQYVKVVLLGAPGVGKTAIVQVDGKTFFPSHFFCSRSLNINPPLQRRHYFLSGKIQELFHSCFFYLPFCQKKRAPLSTQRWKSKKERRENLLQ